MKILWLTNTPCGATEILYPEGFTSGSWLTSLESEIVNYDYVELSIAFYLNKSIQPFKYKKTMYYPICRKGRRSKISRLINRLINKNNEKQDLSCLYYVIDKIKPDIIHIHGTEENFGKISLFTDIPVVISIQGILSSISEKFFSGIPLTEAQKYEGLFPKLTLTSYFFSYKNFINCAIRERQMLAIHNHIIGRTDFDRRITRLLSPNSKYYHIDEIMRPCFFLNKWDKKKFNNVIEIVSILSPGIYKGFETIVKVSNNLQQYGKINYRWRVIGLDETESIVKMVKRWLRIDDYSSLDIFFEGLKSEKEVVDILISSDIYCQVSHIENSPNSLCEAMLLGLPIIASFSGGTSSLLKDGEEGLLVQDGDSYSFSGAILELAFNFEYAKKLAISAYIKARERHNKKFIIKSIMNCYQDVMLQ